MSTTTSPAPDWIVDRALALFHFRGGNCEFSECLDTIICSLDRAKRCTDEMAVLPEDKLMDVDEFLAELSKFEYGQFVRAKEDVRHNITKEWMLSKGDCCLVLDPNDSKDMILVGRCGCEPTLNTSKRMGPPMRIYAKHFVPCCQKQQ